MFPKIRTNTARLILVISFWLCANAAAQNLTVVNGTLGLHTTQGATNDVWANPPATNTVFDRWTGDVSVLADPCAWHTTAVMPANASTVTATYKTSPAWTTTTYIVNGLSSSDPNAVNLVYYFPPNPMGVIFFFHGANGSASGFFTKIESSTFARDAVAAGYAIAALDSNDRVNKIWSSDPTTANVDVQNVQTSINYLTGLGLMHAGTPTFSTGMSYGGFFAPYAAYDLDFKACGIWCASGLTPPASSLFTFTTVPTMWCLAQNDDLYDHPTFLANANTNLSNLTSRNVAGQLFEHPPSPVYPGRFTRIPGISASDSQTAHDRLLSGGFIDAFDNLTSDPETNLWYNTVLTTNTQPYYMDMQDQLDCCYSGHSQYSDYDDKILQFFTATLSFSQWEIFYSLTGAPTATPENDGVSNLYKYLFDINPTRIMTTSDQAALPTVGMTTNAGTSCLTLTYRENPTVFHETPAISDITVNVQTSSNLQTWQTLTNPTITQTGSDSTTGDPIMQVRVPASGSKLFIRLNVTSP